MGGLCANHAQTSSCSLEVMAALLQFDTAVVPGFGAARPMPVSDLGRWVLLHSVGTCQWPNVRLLPPFPAEAQSVRDGAVTTSL